MDFKLDYLIIGPAHPYRGGIADTNHDLALGLQKQGFSVKIVSFKKLYPKGIFPGTSQFTDKKAADELQIERKIYAFNPLQWGNVVRYIKNLAPKHVVFRYYTPFLAPCYSYLGNRLKTAASCIALVDNWIPHEQRPWDRWLTQKIKKTFTRFITLSSAVAEEMKKDGVENIFKGFHPISENRPPNLGQEQARIALGWDLKKPIALFYGLVRPYKGLDLLLSAFLEAPLASADILLAVVGEFYEPQSKYQKQLSELTEKEMLYFSPGFADEAYTQLVFCAADIVVLPYRSASQSGVVPLAYHYQKPLLVTDLPGLKQPIVSDGTGWVCAPNSSALSRKLTVAMNERKEKKQQQLSQARKNYSWEKFVKWMDSVCNG